MSFVFNKPILHKRLSVLSVCQTFWGMIICRENVGKGISIFNVKSLKKKTIYVPSENINKTKYSATLLTLRSFLSFKRARNFVKQHKRSKHRLDFSACFQQLKWISLSRIPLGLELQKMFLYWNPFV